MDQSFGPNHPKFFKASPPALSPAEASGLDLTLVLSRNENIVRERAREFGTPPNWTFDQFSETCYEISAAAKFHPEEFAVAARALASSMPLLMLSGLRDPVAIAQRALKTKEWPAFTASIAEFVREFTPGLPDQLAQESRRSESKKRQVSEGFSLLGVYQVDERPETEPEIPRHAFIKEKDLSDTVRRLLRSRNLSRSLTADYSEFLDTEAHFWMQAVYRQPVSHPIPPSETLLGLLTLGAPVDLIRRFGTEVCSDASQIQKVQILKALGALVTKRIDDVRQLVLPSDLMVAPLLHALGLLNRPRGESMSRESFFESVTPPFRFTTEPSAQHWRHLQSRMEKSDALKGEHRERFILKEINLFVLQVATQRFRLGEDVHFDRLIFGSGSDKDLNRTQKFYNNVYRADQHPAVYESEEEKRMAAETHRELQDALQARTALNVLKAYTQTTAHGDWLVERIAACSGGSATVIRSADFSAYPGSGCIIEGLTPGAFLDLSTNNARRSYAGVYPWIQQNLERLPETSFYMFRGFVSWIRKAAIESDDAPIGEAWKSIEINDVAYAPIVFSDHFQNWNPEMRLLYVPEVVLAPLLRQFHEQGCDPRRVDITPQGIADLAKAFGLPILNVGTAAVAFSGFSSAWPHGAEPYWEWEQKSDYRDTPFRDSFHLHHSFRPGKYARELTPDMAEFFRDLLHGQNQLSKCVNLYSGLFQSWMTAEAVWAKESSYENGVVAKLDLPSRPPADSAAPPAAKDNEGGVRSDSAAIGKDGGAKAPREESSAGNDDTGANLSGSVRPARDYSIHPRTRILQAFLDARARTIEQFRRRGETPKPSDFPRLEIQYAGKYDAVPGSPVIRGGDLTIRRPGNSRIPLFTEAELSQPDLKVGEHQEFLWYEHVSRPGAFFKLHYGPRIVW